MPPGCRDRSPAATRYAGHPSSSLLHFEQHRCRKPGPAGSNPASTQTRRLRRALHVEAVAPAIECDVLDGREAGLCTASTAGRVRRAHRAPRRRSALGLIRQMLDEPGRNGSPSAHRRRWLHRADRDRGRNGLGVERRGRRARQDAGRHHVGVTDWRSNRAMVLASPSGVTRSTSLPAASATSASPLRITVRP